MNRSDDEEMQFAINKMKNGKISGPSGVVYKILKTGGVPSELMAVWQPYLQWYLLLGYVARGMDVEFVGTNF